jgi:two-component system, NtrC family, nitrogen regulation sensor histidine kinase GlnL
MKASRALQEKVLGNLNAAVFLVKPDSEICYMNQAAESVLGMSFQRAEGAQLYSLLAISEEDSQAIENAREEFRPFTRRQAKVRDIQGVEKTVDFSVIPLDLTEGQYLVVEVRELDRLMRINREELQSAAHDTTRQLVRGLAHEVKNPLGGILGAAQLLHQELDDPELQEYTSVIAEETNRLRNLVDRMLGPNQRPRFALLNVHQVVERVATLLEVETRGNVRIVKDYDPSVPEVYADSEQLIQAVLNVGRNALEALTDAKIENPEITLRTRVQYRVTLGHIQHALIARIDIVDNGPGIDEALVDEIFYPMISGRDKGTGLGLSIAQSIVSVHKGLIECTSRPGETQFSIYLPIAEEPPSGGGH